MKALVQGDMPMLDAEIPAVNGVVTARGLAKMYGALANGGGIEGTQLLSAQLVRGLTGTPSRRPDRNLLVPMDFHLGYHSVVIPGVLPGLGHVGLAGTVGWADPATGMAFGFVHNRLLSKMVLDQISFVGLGALIRRGASLAREHGAQSVPTLGSPFTEPRGRVRR
jgi:CubicO group peptidase (beta-lactamase class C family)